MTHADEPIKVDETIDESVADLGLRLDELLLERIDSIDEQLVLMKKLESQMAQGYLQLAKSRYIGGERSFCSLQIPGEDAEHRAQLKVEHDAELSLQAVHDPDGNDAAKWFGLLVPTSLRQSQRAFRNAAELAVAVVNARRRWTETPTKPES